MAANLIPEEGTLGVRIPDHKFCQGLLRRFGRPIVSTSANITGEPTPKRLPEIAREIVDGVDYVGNPRFEGRPTGKPSSIIAFSDIDSFRHVNNVSQQMYFDVGKSDFFDRLLGPEILFAPVRIITAATDTSYMGQIRFEDRIAVTTCVERIGTKSLTLLQRIVADDGTVRSQSRSVMVAFDFEAQQSVPGPDAWRRALEAE